MVQTERNRRSLFEPIALGALCAILAAIAFGCSSNCSDTPTGSKAFAWSCQMESTYGESCIDFLGDEWTVELAMEACLELCEKDEGCAGDASMVQSNCDQNDFDTFCVVEAPNGYAWMYFNGLPEDVCRDIFGGVIYETNLDPDEEPGPDPDGEHLLVIFEFNSLPIVKVTVDAIQSGEADLAGAKIEMSVTAVDPEGDPIDAILWSEECAHADFEGNDINSESVVLIPTATELCSTLVQVFSSGSYVQAHIALDISCVLVVEYVDGGAPDRNMNSCSLQGACVPTSDPCAGLECGSAVNSCGWSQSCGTCSGQDTCVDNMCESGCEDLRTDGEICGSAGAVCGSMDDNCGVERSCGSCGTGETCRPDQTACEAPSNIIFRCIAVNYGADSCVDFLTRDAWDAQTAQEVCTLSSPDTPAFIEECEEFVDCCKALAPTRTPYAWRKRCEAHWVATDTPAPHEPYYVYLPNFFPDNVCFNNLGGTLITESTGVFPNY